MFDRRDRDNRQVTKADKVWLHSIVKRQFMVVDDLIKFARLYPEQVDREIVGSLFSIYEMLRDNAESITYSHCGEQVSETPTYRSRLWR